MGWKIWAISAAALCVAACTPGETPAAKAGKTDAPKAVAAVANSCSARSVPSNPNCLDCQVSCPSDERAICYNGRWHEGFGCSPAPSCRCESTTAQPRRSPA